MRAHHTHQQAYASWQPATSNIALSCPEMQPPSSQQTSPSRDAAPQTHRTKLPKSNSLRANYTPPQPIRPKPTSGDLQGAKEHQHDPRTSNPHVYDSYSSSTAIQSKSRYHSFPPPVRKTKSLSPTTKMAGNKSDDPNANGLCTLNPLPHTNRQSQEIDSIC